MSERHLCKEFSYHGCYVSSFTSCSRWSLQLSSKPLQGKSDGSWRQLQGETLLHLGTASLRLRLIKNGREGKSTHDRQPKHHIRGRTYHGARRPAPSGDHDHAARSSRWQDHLCLEMARVIWNKPDSSWSSASGIRDGHLRLAPNPGPGASHHRDSLRGLRLSWVILIVGEHSKRTTFLDGATRVCTHRFGSCSGQTPRTKSIVAWKIGEFSPHGWLPFLLVSSWHVCFSRHILQRETLSIAFFRTCASTAPLSTSEDEVMKLPT